MADSAFDPWKRIPLHGFDPLYARDADYCRTHHTPGGFLCTRPVGHPGLHVAGYGGGTVCAVWEPEMDPSQRLPTGF